MNGALDMHQLLMLYLCNLVWMCEAAFPPGCCRQLICGQIATPDGQGGNPHQATIGQALLVELQRQRHGTGLEEEDDAACSGECHGIAHRLSIEGQLNVLLLLLQVASKTKYMMEGL